MKVFVHTPIKVTLAATSWKDLINFVRGDLDNMEENEIKKDMRIYCDHIEKEINKQS